jgi:HK97 gp10 family phage protein
MKIGIEIKNLDSIQETLKLLPQKLSLQLINSVLRKVANETLVKPIRSALPYSMINRKTGKRVGVKGIKVQGTRDKNRILVGAVRQAYWLRFLEKGTKSRKSKGGVVWRGMSPRPIIEPVSDRQIPIVINKINDEFSLELNKFIVRRLKKINV